MSPQIPRTVEGVAVGQLPPCVQSCIASSLSGPDCAGELGCACHTPENLDSLACCISSSCSQADLQITIGIFTRDVCLPTVIQDFIDSAKCGSVNSLPDLRKRQKRRHTLPINVARTTVTSSRDSPAAEIQRRASDPSDNSSSGSSGLSTGAMVGIIVGAVCGVLIILLGLFLYLRRRKRVSRKNSPVEAAKKQISKPQISISQKQQQEVDMQYQQEQEQLQQQLQQMQRQLGKQKLLEEKEKQRKREKEQNQQKEDSHYVAELFELPGWMPERRTTVNELADTGYPRYEMFTEANTAELSGGTPVNDNEDGQPQAHYSCRSQSYAAELAGASVHLSEDDELTPLKRSHSDGGNIISPEDRMSPDSERGSSPWVVSPPTATIPRTTFFRNDWRLTEGVQAPMAPFSYHPTKRMALSLDTGGARGLVSAGKKATGQRVGGRMADMDPE